MTLCSDKISAVPKTNSFFFVFWFFPHQRSQHSPGPGAPGAGTETSEVTGAAHHYSGDNVSHIEPVTRSANTHVNIIQWDQVCQHTCKHHHAIADTLNIILCFWICQHLKLGFSRSSVIFNQATREQWSSGGERGHRGHRGQLMFC